MTTLNDPSRASETGDDAFWDIVSLIEPLPWTKSALCAETDPEAFFPEKGESTSVARQVCNACPVREECLNDALARDEQFGVWGGHSVVERRKIARERGIKQSAKKRIYNKTV